MTATATNPAPVCPECGTPADADIPTYARARTRRSLIPLIVVALLLGTVVAGTFLTWSPAPVLWNSTSRVSDPFPIPTLSSVADLQFLLDGPVVPSTRLRDTLLLELETRTFEPHEPAQGDLQITLSKHSGTITHFWWIGWPVGAVAASHRIYYSDIRSMQQSVPPAYYSQGVYTSFTLAGLSINGPYRSLMLNIGGPLLMLALLWSLWPLIRRLRAWVSKRAPFHRVLLRLLGVLLVLTAAIVFVWPTVKMRIEYDPLTTTVGTPISPFSREYHSTGLTRTAAIQKLKSLPNDVAVARELFDCVNKIAQNNPEFENAKPMLAIFGSVGVANSAVPYGWPTPFVIVNTETWPTIAPESRTVQFRRGELEITTRSTTTAAQRRIVSIQLMNVLFLLTYLTLAWHFTRLLIRRTLTTRSTTRRVHEHCINCNYPLPSSHFDGTSILTAAQHRREARARASTPDNPPPAS